MSSEVPPEVQALRTRSLKDLKAILASRAKVGIPIHLLCHEYEETTFEKLKFREMGYGTIVQLVNDYPDYFMTCKDPSGHIIVKAIPSKEDAHIHRLVSGQKIKSKKKTKKLVQIPVRRKLPHFTSLTRNARGKPPQTFITARNRMAPLMGSQHRSYSHSINTFQSTAFRNKPTVHQSNIPPRFQKNRPNAFFSTRSSAPPVNRGLSSTSSNTNSNMQNSSNNNTGNQGFQPNTSTPTNSVSPSGIYICY